jgi:hypothetical protein
LRTINVYQARLVRRKSVVFTVWQMVTRSGMGVEEQQMYSIDGLSPFDPSDDPWEIVDWRPLFQVYVDEADLES